MNILGIETSCDETSAAVVENGTTILSNIVASSKDLHEKTGGIIPEIAAREQMKCILPVVTEALASLRGVERRSNPVIRSGSPRSQLLSGPRDDVWHDIDAIAVTVGPGLIGSLLVGVETAKTLSMVTGKPVIPVNHIFAHIYANFIQNRHNAPRPPLFLRGGDQVSFPALALVVSGGHTELFLMEDHGKLTWLGGTMDDAAGEAFDKTARMIGLGYGGGLAIAAEAAKYRIKNQELRIALPRPMMHDDTLNFSFSGLKTAVMREIQSLEKNQQWDDAARQEMAWEIQEAITDVLVKKTLKAAEQYKVTSILLGGGVAANQRLGEKLRQRLKTNDQQLYIPEPHLCTDNAAVIASYSYFNQQPVSWTEIQADPGLAVEVT